MLNLLPSTPCLSSPRPPRLASRLHDRPLDRVVRRRGAGRDRRRLSRLGRPARRQGAGGGRPGGGRARPVRRRRHPAAGKRVRARAGRLRWRVHRRLDLLGHRLRQLPPRPLRLRRRGHLPRRGGNHHVRAPLARSSVSLASSAVDSPLALDIDGLVKRYETGTEALRGVSLDIQDGEFFGLLGPNGAGKSTLIHCATGLARPTAGEIRIFGHDALDDYEQARTAVGLAAQELNLDWFLTVEETLDYHAGYFGMPKSQRRERAAELLDAFSLGDKRRERVRTLSGGMKRRLVLARALMHRPRLLILDEPTAGVDVELRLELWHYVQRIDAEGTTILLTTH